MIGAGTDKAKLTFGDLKVGEHFIMFPEPGDNEGHGGYLGGAILFKKIISTESNCAINGRGVISHCPDTMPVLKEHV